MTSSDAILTAANTQTDAPAGLEPFGNDRRRPLDAMFAPKSVAVIGATETAGSVGRTVMANLMSTPFGGVLYPINPKRDHVLGVECYRSIGEVAAPVDLAVVVTPARAVPGVIREC